MNYRSKLRDNPTYRSWERMRSRCLDKNSEDAKHYQARGITICEEWNSFAQFERDMGERPEGLTIERIDNDKGYYADNCRWATRKEQANNRSSCVLLTFSGITQNLTQWAKATGIARNCLQKRVSAGWSTNRILTQPSQRMS